tara:strand:- start:258 stop:455 length:198 start_codon:yes stop_codon:yes gene_type:complete
MNIEKIPSHILADLRENLTDEEIERASANYLFCEYCNWNNLGGWGSSLIETLDSLRACEETGVAK